MCSIYSHADPILYENRSRSIRIAGVITNIRLENLFWQTLSEIAEDASLTTNQLICKLHEEVEHYAGAPQNFASFLRVTCLRYQALKSAALTQARAALPVHVRASLPPTAPALPR